MNKSSCNSKKVNRFTIFFAVVLIGIIILWIVSISKQSPEEKKYVNGFFILGFAFVIGVLLCIMKKPLKIKLTLKKDHYHPENYSDHSEMYRQRKNIK